jgi:6-carboxyhexanoate--CoA ligase
MAELYSIKMRSSACGVHISGAERIVKRDLVEPVALELLKRAMTHSRGKPDFISIKVELLKTKPVPISLLPVFDVNENLKGEEVLSRIFPLTPIGNCGMEIYRLLLSGPAPGGGVMRGAMIVEVPSGKRLERDSSRGVRASYLDITEKARRKLKEISRDYTENFCDALVLSSKVLSFPGVVGELCVSDDPDYTTGYLSLSGVGYIRIRRIKERGLAKGGRAIFVEKKVPVSKLVEFLEKTPVLAEEVTYYSCSSLEKVVEIVTEAFSL